MQKYINNVTDRFGNAMAGLSVRINLAGTQTLASIFSDNGSAPKANPFTTDTLGNFYFYAADGRYDILVGGTGYYDVIIADGAAQATDISGLVADVDDLNSDVTTLSGAVTALDTTAAKKPELAAASGASTIGFQQSGAGAMLRTNQNKFRTWIEVLDYIPESEHDAIYNGTTTYDAATAFQAAANEAVAKGKGLRCEFGKLIKINSAVDLRGLRQIDIRANIQSLAGMGAPAITVGGLSSGGTADIYFADVTDGTNLQSAPPPTLPVLRIFGLKSANLRIGGCNYLQFWADSGTSGGDSNAYNHIWFSGVMSKVELTDSGAAVSWNNENHYYGGRVIRLGIIGVGYFHNHNKFYNNIFENTSVSLTFVKAWTNYVYGARFENVAGAPGVSFDAQSQSNRIYSTWSGVGNPRGQFQPAGLTISDLGVGNAVTTLDASEFKKTKLTSVSAASLIVGNATDSIADEATIANDGYTGITTKQVLTPSLGGFEAISNRLITLTGYIPVMNGDSISMNADFDGTLLRARIYVYDANYQPLTSEGVGGAYVDSPALVFNAIGVYSHSTDRTAAAINASAIAIIRPEVKYIRFGYFSATGGVFRSISAYLFTQSLARGVTEGDASPRYTPRVLTGAPTKGYLPRTYTLFETGGKINYWVTFSYETTVNGALAAGATSVAVTTPSTIANGDIVGLLMDNGATHWTTVSGLAGSTFTIAAVPVGRSVANGARIAFNRWAS